MTASHAQRPDPLVLLAPMAGITDRPFRDLVSGFGADLVVSEMVASQAAVQGKPDMRTRAELGAAREGTVVQLAGREAHWMAEAARLVEQQGARRIDINMGCPARKVTNGLAGSALMRDLDHAQRLIEAVVSSVSVPVSLKMRLGWDDACVNAPELARRAEGVGVSMVTVHGRTRCQFYAGHADWAAVRAVRRATRLPLIVNGDIASAAAARQALDASGADGVMVGRGARGRPWLLAEILAAFGRGARPTIGALSDLVARHYEAALSLYGTELGVRVMRKHLGWYLEACPADTLRQALLREDDPGSVLAMIASRFPEEAAQAA